MTRAIYISDHGTRLGRRTASENMVNEGHDIRRRVPVILVDIAGHEKTVRVVVNESLLDEDKVPRRCGIATFTHDLATAVARYVDQPIGTGDHVSIIAVNDGDSTYDYGPEVALSFRQHRIGDYHRAADFLNTTS